MNFEIGSCDVKKVKEFLEKEGVQYSEASSCHEMVVQVESVFTKDGLIDELEYEGLNDDEKDRRILLLEEATNTVYENAELVVNEDFSFSSVQESVKNRILEEYSKRV